MSYDFENFPRRWGMDSGKWAPLEKTKWAFSDEIAPFSTADMDLLCAPEIRAEIEKLAALGIYGYGNAGPAFTDAVQRWMARRHGWQVEAEWMVTSAGVVPALFLCVQAFTRPGDGVIIQTPVYFPFRFAIAANGREVLENRLLEQDGHYEMDFDDLEEQCKKAKMLILCSPHNPVGRVWTEEELRRVGEICGRHNVLVVADEIHHDLILGPRKHSCYAALDAAFAQNCVIATAASKSFNLAGFATSSIIIPNESLREAYKKAATAAGAGMFNSYMGPAATTAAYNKGEAWLEALLEHLRGNYAYLCSFLAENIPQLRVSPLEGTYLAWLDCRALGLAPEARTEFLLQDCGILTNAGRMFGAGGEGFERWNLACPRKVLADALERLRAGLNARGML